MRRLLLGVALLGACGQPAPSRVNVETSNPERSSTTTTPDSATTVPEPTTEPIEVVRPAPARTVPNTTTTVRATQLAPVRHGGDVWWDLALCESGGANVDTGNGFSGYFQFLDSTWRSVGYSGRAVDYSYETQVAGAQTLQARSGWSPWPACARQMGLL